MAIKATINHDSIKDIVLELSKVLGTDHDEDNNELCFDLPKKLGDGHFRAIEFDFGVGIILADFLINEKMTLTFKKEKINPLKIFLNLDAPIQFIDQEHSTKLNRLESVMVSPSTNECQNFVFNSNKPITFFYIQINRKLFESKVEQFIGDMSEDLETLLRDLNGINKFYYNGYFSLDIAELIEEFKTCELTDFMQSVFLEGKTYEVIMRYLQLYVDKNNSKNSHKLIRQSSIIKIEKAVAIIKKELDVRISVNALAKRVGLNQNTLQSGFKQLFSTSVNEYIRDQKIEYAKNLLEKSDLNITEITYKIGINSRSYFSKLFKERYSVTPKEYLLQCRKRKSKSA
ncbi:helix-turn-helix transcriptional regulator [Lacinutrix sp. 5H-3-7-4]|uniref:helix-turn-helix transcriptional regulator n=1 Tax=Lacinutrix sp. (strain 5H-3-7-4) TaxID=983544 RepID=UPI00020A34DC|nr:AraC family transcriptional regulator [Lacinutrix sp. 5H-3-7-4]AEH01746.1 transcriptional regulator, AraC family [Lacinutrix sp. 5H-3-7-4]